MSEEEATKAVMTLTHDELENQVYATGSITYAVEAVLKHVMDVMVTEY